MVYSCTAHHNHHAGASLGREGFRASNNPCHTRTHVPLLALVPAFIHFDLFFSQTMSFRGPRGHHCLACVSTDMYAPRGGVM